MPRIRLKCCLILFILFSFSSLIIFLLNPQSSPTKKTHLFAPPHLVKRTETFLVVVIISAVQNSAKRNAIRSTWLKLSPNDIRHTFVIGDEKRSSDDLREEIRQNDDILLLPKTSDAYDSLTVKVLRAFVHINRKWNFKFLLKCDDDSFVRVEDVVFELKSQFPGVNNLYWGFFHGSAVVRRRGKWKETKWNLCDYYLPYALGGGYILSQSLVQFIAENERHLVIFQPEDVSVGTWLAPVNVTRIHDPRFDTEYASRGCSNSYLITHKHSIINMRQLYLNLMNTGNLCETEYKLRLSYLYNWDVQPSKCCYRSNHSIP